MKPAVRVAVGTAHGAQNLPGCTVASTHTGRRTIRAGDNWHFTFPDADTKLVISDVSDVLDVEVMNQTTVPLILTTRLKNGDVLTDILNHNKREHIAGGARVTIHT